MVDVFVFENAHIDCTIKCMYIVKNIKKSLDIYSKRFDLVDTLNQPLNSKLYNLQNLLFITKFTFTHQT